MKARLYYLDSAGAILLIYMIVAHCCQWANVYDSYLKYILWLRFSMPWFFFKAGMFFRNRPIKEVISKSFNRLIIPFIVFSVIGTVLLWITQAITGELTLRSLLYPIEDLIKDGSVAGNLPLWFLRSLFCVRIFFSITYNKIETAANDTRKYLTGRVLGVICCLFLLMCHVLDTKGIRYPYYLSNISSGMIFYTLGYILRDYKPKMSQTVCMIALYVFFMFFLPAAVDMRTGQLIEGYFLLWVPVSTIGILTTNSLFYHFLNKPNVLSQIGAETMPYYCMHWCVIIIVSLFFNGIGNAPDIRFLIASVIANIILLPILTYYIKKSRYSFIIQ